MRSGLGCLVATLAIARERRRHFDPPSAGVVLVHVVPVTFGD